MSQNNKHPTPTAPSFLARQKNVAKSLVSKAITFPVETLKLVQQNKMLLPGFARLSSFQILKNRISADGFLSLWSGYSYAILKSILTDNLLSVISPTAKRLIGRAFSTSYVGSMLPGAVPSIISQSLMQPLDTLVTASAVLAPAMSLSALLSPLSARSSLPGAGFMTRAFPILSALYSGLPITLFGLICFRIVYFILYDSSKSMLDTVKDPKLRKYAVFFHGVGASLFAATLTYPFDTIRRVQCITSMQGQETSIFDAARIIWNTSGVWGFFAGDNANGVRTVAAACVLLTLDSLVK